MEYSKRANRPKSGKIATAVKAGDGRWRVSSSNASKIVRISDKSKRIMEHASVTFSVALSRLADR